MVYFCKAANNWIASVMISHLNVSVNNPLIEQLIRTFFSSHESK